MENRIVIKKINFLRVNKLEDFGFNPTVITENELIDKKHDLKIKLYHNKITQISDIIWDYENNEIINWKFIIDYDSHIAIDFILLENDIFDENNIIGHGFIKNINKEVHKNLSQNVFPEPIFNIINIENNNIIIANIEIEQYILLKDKTHYYNCGIGWSPPDDYPKLDIFPYKHRNEIFENIRIIEDNYVEDSENNGYCEAFLRIINDNNNKPPMCFGIIAPDNYGKSRLLQNLKKKINIINDISKEEKFIKSIVTIEFNPWNFEADDTIWASILMNIHDSLEGKIGKFNLKWLRIKKNFFPTTTSIIFFMLKIIIPIIILIILYIYDFYYNNTFNIILTISLSISSILFFKDVFNLLKYLIFSISDIINKMKKPDWTNKLGFMNEIKNEFLDFINPIIKEYNCKLVLLIDDLDKCSIDKIYSVIKALSLLKYSDCPIYIFLTYDSVKINDAIKSYYKNKHLVNTYEGKHLLNKLITIPFCLPEKSIVENISLLDKYIIESTISNNDLTDKVPINYNNLNNLNNLNIYNGNIKDDVKLILPNSPIYAYFNIKGLSPKLSPKYKNSINYDKLNQMETNINKNNLTFLQLENYYKYLVKIEQDIPNNEKIKHIKNLIYSKFIKLKTDFTNNYYIGLDSDEINLFQQILQETKYSNNYINNSQIIKIINMYSIARFLLPNYLKYKKNKLFHLILITENWQKIIVDIYFEIRQIKINLSIDKIKECFDNKELLFFYLNNNKIIKNDELILYLTKFEIKITDFIDLEMYIINLDRCFNTII